MPQPRQAKTSTRPCTGSKPDSDHNFLDMRPRFRPDSDSGRSLTSSRLIDPEAYDAGEQEFAASLQQKSLTPRFVADHEPILPPSDETAGIKLEIESRAKQPVDDSIAPDDKEVQLGPQSTLLEEPQPDTWRKEVAARVNNYRARRRPRAPRYPSLLLKFDLPQIPERPDVAAGVQAACETIVGASSTTTQNDLHATFYGHQASPAAPEAAESARILEFPRAPLALPSAARCGGDELAEPVFDRPRILDVPEPLPPPPALGGIALEPREPPETAKRLGFELPLQPAARKRRFLAVSVDAIIVLTAFSVFAAIFWKITSMVPPLLLAAEFAPLFLAGLWVAYQYSLLVYTGTTPGLMAARLRLSRFDGDPVPRRLRRWRVFASVLSGASLGLGYAWYFLDEDHLCWHDRITHTYMAPVPPAA